MSVRPSSARRPFSKAAVVVVFGLLSLVLGISVAAAETDGRGDSSRSMQIKAETFGLSVAVRDLDSRDSGSFGGQSPPRINPLAGEPGGGADGTRSPDARPDDLLAQGRAGGRTPAPSLVFDGIDSATGCGGCVPPDPTGDVGPNHYIQMVNSTKVAIHNKSGSLLAPAFDLSTLFTSGSCSTFDIGDPQVLYDELADRWLLSQFAPGDQLCFAISQTPDPTGAYFTYSYVLPEFPDYFKVGVWPTGYYVGTNESSYYAYAFDRTKMLSGDSAAIGIELGNQDNFLMPADLDGSASPSSQGGLFYTFKDDGFHGGGDRLELYEGTPDFANPTNSTFSTVATIPITPFTYTVCGFFVLDCIPQKDTAEGLDPVSEWPMQRLAYRRFGDHEALVGNFTVDVGSDRAGIRWFELRNTGTGYTLHQEGTHAPGDGLSRWMGSIAMDRSGDIALGYSVSSSTEFPSIRYATRTPSDPPGTLQAEQTMKTGGGSQTSISNRWGDYSAMTVDPANACDFWQTSEYYSATSVSSWKTAIGKFREPNCDSTPPETTITSGPSGTTSNASPSFAFTSSESGSTFECELDGGGFSPCSSPKSYAGLPDGPHNFKVRATDPAGNTDPTPASSDFTVDATPPETTITSGPSGTTSNASPSFAFTSSESGSTFECELDGGGFSPCSSPKSYAGLPDGPHNFKVRATDPAGNTDPTPASSDFSVDTTVYKAKISKVKVKGPAKVKRKKKATYKVRITNSGNATATGVRLKVKGRGVSFNTSVGKIGAKKTRTVKVRLKARKAGKVKVSFKVTSKNAGGKTVKKKITVRK